MNNAEILALALVLDAVFGEPRWVWDRLPHPAVQMGRLIGWADRQFNRGGQRQAWGAAMIALLTASAAGLGWGLSSLPWPLETLLVAILLAQRSLCDHVDNVAGALAVSLQAGREAVGRIVGRDTATLDTPGTARAAIESAAENLSDGIVAPALFYLVLGLPGLLAYKLVNTADSMVGYRTERHAAFGWASARLDDLLNLAPARLSALLILATHGRPQDFARLKGDAALHRSPNAGWPEAAMARVLDVALSGPRVYHGTPTTDPFVNETGRRDIGQREIRAAVATLWRVWAALLALSILAATVN
ncbi:MAG TPA: cobalamin biosynthesis protein [Aliiroseovarius sp.]|nr:cobalamin biosynthesis protein [Aliiroseovarius sp.]